MAANVTTKVISIADVESAMFYSESVRLQVIANLRDFGLTPAAVIDVNDEAPWWEAMNDYGRAIRVDMSTMEGRADAATYLGLDTYRKVGAVAIDADAIRSALLVAGLTDPTPEAMADAAADYVAARTSDRVFQTVATVPETGVDFIVGAGMSDGYTLTMGDTMELLRWYAEILAARAEQISDERFIGNESRMVSAVLMRNGTQFCGSIELPTVMVDPNGLADAHRFYAGVADSADRTMNLRLGVSGVRQVCSNTAAAAWGSRDKQLSRALRHSSGMSPKLAATFTELADATIADAAAYAVRAERLLTVSDDSQTDRLWRVAMSKLTPGVFTPEGINPSAKPAKRDQANGLMGRLRELAETDETNYPTTGRNAYGIVQTLTGFPRNHAEPERRSVADAKNADGELTDDSIAAWRASLADIHRATGEGDAMTQRFMTAAEAVQSEALAMA